MHTLHAPAQPSRSPQSVPAESVRPVSADWDPWHERLTNVSVLPAQFFSPPTSLYTGRPEAALLQAVLEDALACFQSQLMTAGGRVQREAQEAAAWFWSEEDHGIFSFVSVCAVLGLEPESIRARLRRWRHTHPTPSPRKRQRVAVRHPPQGDDYRGSRRARRRNETNRIGHGEACPIFRWVGIRRSLGRGPARPTLHGPSQQIL